MLTVVQIRALEPRSRPYTAFDSDGLFLLVQPSGSLLWRFRYRKFGIERKLSLGSFPDISLQQARKERDKALAQLVDDIDPVEEKRAPLESRACRPNHVQARGRRVHPENGKGGKVSRHDQEGAVVSRTAGGHREAPDCLDHAARAARRLEADRAPRSPRDGEQIAILCRPRVSLRFCDAADRAEPCAGRSSCQRSSITLRSSSRRRSALLRAIDDYEGRPETVFALKLAPHVFLRPGELRQAKWSEIDFARCLR